MSKQITETELRALTKALNGQESSLVVKAMRLSFEAIGFEVIPDPVPEPAQGSAIVKDFYGDLWERLGDGWVSETNSRIREWAELLRRAPLTVYRAEEPEK